MNNGETSLEEQFQVEMRELQQHPNNKHEFSLSHRIRTADGLKEETRQRLLLELARIRAPQPRS